MMPHGDEYEYMMATIRSNCGLAAIEVEVRYGSWVGAGSCQLGGAVVAGRNDDGVQLMAMRLLE